MLIGSVSTPMAENVPPAKLNLEMATEALLSFVTIMLLFATCPMGTVPKSTVPGVIWRLPSAGP